MFSNPKLKYLMIFITVVIVVVVLFRLIINYNKIELKLTIYSNCERLSDAEVIIDGKSRGETDASGEIRFKINYDHNEPKKMVKINLAGQSSIEPVILDQNKKRGIQERNIFFKQNSTNVSLITNPENIYYTIIDKETGCVLIDQEPGSSTIRMIVGHEYEIKYSLNANMNDNVKYKNFIPTGFDDNQIQLEIYELYIKTTQKKLFYRITENGDPIDSRYGTYKFYYDQQKELKIIPNQGESLTVQFQKNKWIYEKTISGIVGTPGLCDHQSDIRVNNSSAKWELKDLLNNNEIIYQGEGDEIVGGLCKGQYAIEEQGSFSDLQMRQPHIFTIYEKQYNIEYFPLKRISLTILPYPIDSRWEIKSKGQTIKNNNKKDTISNLLPGSYEYRCKTTSGTPLPWKTINLNNDDSINLTCSRRCNYPRIDLALRPDAANWKIDIMYDGTSSEYMSGSGHNKNIKVQLNQIHRISVTHNDNEVIRDNIIFDTKHQTCREIIDINMEAPEILMDAAGKKEDWPKVIEIDKSSYDFGDERKCSDYLYLAKAYNDAEDFDRAYDYILEGWSRLEDFFQCAYLEMDEGYLFLYFQLIEEKFVNDGIDNMTPDLITEIGEKVNNILQMPSSSLIELGATTIKCKIDRIDILKYMSEWDSMYPSEKASSNVQYCRDTKKWRNHIDDLLNLMDELDKVLYKDLVKGYKIESEAAYNTFKCYEID